VRTPTKAAAIFGTGYVYPRGDGVGSLKNEGLKIKKDSEKGKTLQERGRRKRREWKFAGVHKG